MHNFEFYNPVKVLFGKNQIASLKNEIPKDSKVLILYGGGSIKKNGVYDQVTSSLKEYTFFEYAGVTPNPQYEQLLGAIELIKKESIDFILAVGGGSVVDAAKFVAAAVHQKSDPWLILSKREPIESVMPFGCVLTLPATGSEMNSFSVISKGSEKLGFGGDPRLYPKFSVLDPCVTYSLPERQLGNGIVDAFVHTTEQYLTTHNHTPLQDRQAEAILMTLIEEAPKVLELKEHYESRANLMWAATNALNGTLGLGVDQDWATHMIGHELTALYNIDHARSLAIILPSLLRVKKEAKKEKLLQLASRVWGLNDGTPEERINIAILKIEDFFNSVGVPTTFKAYGIEESEIPKIISSLEKHFSKDFSLGEHGDINAEKVTEILKGAF